MNLNERISALSLWGIKLKGKLESADSQLEDLIQLANAKNGWFEQENVRYALTQLLEMLNKEALRSWAMKEKISDFEPQKQVGLIMAGNLPLVGFHDVLCVLISGNRALVKQSSKDTVLWPFLIDELCTVSEPLANRIELTEGMMKSADAFIATGSDNSAKYFEHYFAKFPNIIRKNRTSVAVLDGSENDQQLMALGADVLRYFGLGCRNVTKLFVPNGYNFDSFFKAIMPWSHIMNNAKYFNNYQYNRTVFLLNSETFLDNDFVIIKEDESLFSPVGVVHYEFYNDEDELDARLTQEETNIQTRVGYKGIPFGTTQQPQLTDYADGVNALAFLTSLA